ncbi:MAG: hypothetical protein H0T76_21430 [Nannocystis sp.]|nr:hypothetical protein [Nannocystis sp.]MBA3549054.1 hypothetical protein [Nannocystis sp.]
MRTSDILVIIGALASSELACANKTPAEAVRLTAHLASQGAVRVQSIHPAP